jgi:hypothetical protein
MAQTRSSFPVWLIIVLALTGTGVLVIAGAAGFFWFQWSARASGPPKQYARQGFTFDYPASWTVDDQDKDYDPDHMFSIDASDGAMAMFVVLDGELDPVSTLQAHVKVWSKKMPNAKQTEFKRWGKFDGVGVSLHGSVLGLLRWTSRIFVFNAADKTFTVIEFFPDDENQQLAPGYRMIENSFRVAK